MRHKYLVYCLIVALFCSLGSWANLARNAAGGRGSGNSWHSGSGYSGGGFATGGGGGHK